MPTPPLSPAPSSRFAPLRRGSQPIFVTSKPDPATSTPQLAPAPDPQALARGPAPEQTRPAGSSEVAATAPQQPEPWVRTPSPLFQRPPAAHPGTPQAIPDASTAAEPALPHDCRTPPAPQPEPVKSTSAKPKKPSLLSKLALWSDAPSPLFRQPGRQAAQTGVPGTAVTVAQHDTRPPAPTLLTGATGFVGSAVARALAAEGYTLRLLVRPGADRGNLDGMQAEIVEGDLNDPASLTAALQGCRYLVHVAADYRLWVPNPKQMIATNVEGTRALMQAAQAAGVERIVYCSSVAALGLPDDGSPGDEDTPVYLEAIVGAYKNSKFEAERVVRAMAQDGLPVVIVNPSAPVGPRDRRPTPTGKMILDAAAGRMPAYVETGLNIVHVDDVGRGHVLALQHGRVGETYILGGEDLGMVHLLALIDDVMGRPPQKRARLNTTVLAPIAAGSELKARVFGTEPQVTREMLAMADKQMFYSSAKAADALGYTARPARQAITDAVAWFRQAGMLRD